MLLFVSVLSQMEIKPNTVKSYKLKQRCWSLHGLICGYLLLMSGKFRLTLFWHRRGKWWGGTKIMALNHKIYSISWCNQRCIMKVDYHLLRLNYLGSSHSSSIFSVLKGVLEPDASIRFWIAPWAIWFSLHVCRGNEETSVKRLKCIIVNTLPLTSPFQRSSKQFYMVLVLKLRRWKANIWAIDLVTIAWWIWTKKSAYIL